MKKIVYIVLILAGVIFAQKNYSSTVYYEHYVLHEDDSSALFLFYRIPYNNLVFEKNNEDYNASFSLFIEVIDTLGNIAARDTREDNLVTDSFDKTNSNTIFYENLFRFKIIPGFYTVNLYLKDVKSNREIPLKPFTIETKEFSGNILRPLIITESKLNTQTTYLVTNFEGNIPFDENEYQLLIPAAGTNLESITLLMFNDTDTVFTEKPLMRSFTGGLNFRLKDGKIFADISGGQNFSFFLLKDFSKKLIEGPLGLGINKDNKFMSGVKWYNKPFSLSDKEFAIKQLKNVVSEDSVQVLLDNDTKDYNRVLHNFWKPLDRTKSSAFNPTMEEFYKRIDFALRNFSTISKVNGAETDRGKVYIKYGKADKIERSSDTNGFMVEMWEYVKLKLVFYFRDEKGTGEFKLINE